MKNKYYVFLGIDPYEDENCYLNYNTEKKKYYIDSRIEGKSISTGKLTTITKFNEQQIEQAKQDLSNMEIRDEDLIPVTE